MFPGDDRSTGGPASGLWTTLAVELLQVVIIGVYSSDKMAQDVEKVGYRPLTLQ